MALSEHEQRLLDEMERNFYQSDADLADVGAPRGRVDYTAVTIGALVIVLGIGLAVGGVAGQLWWLGVIGFVVMFAGSLIMLRRKPMPSQEVPVREGRESATFMNAFERRWDRRQDRKDGGE